MIASFGTGLAGTDLWELVLLLGLLAMSGFFSGSETSLFNLTAGQLYRMRNAGRAGRMVVLLMKRPRRVLNTLLLGNMLVNVAYASIASVMILHASDAWGLAGWQAFLVNLAPLLVLILLGEVAPKMLALVIGEKWALAAAVPLTTIGRVFRPLLAAMEVTLVSPLTRLFAPRPAAGGDITAEELNALLDLSAKRGILDHSVNELLQEIVALTDLRVGDIMVPRVDMIAHDLHAPPAELVEKFRATRLRKIPVYEGDLDHVLGVVHAKRMLLNPGADPRGLVVKVPFVPEAGSVERALLQFRVTRTQMAIVVDEYGGTAGLVTLHDIVEEIVGEIPEPAERSPAPAVERLGPREFLLDGNLAIHDWADAFKMDLSGKRISTIGGFVTSLLGRIARVGDTVTYRNLSFAVESMRRRRIDRLRLTLQEEPQ
ncbi:MAG TPA: hypothetical protein DCX07_12035 [Phycisphaerales bacterium]|nr:hypothetical protein [Phycisphaerales bacterium]